MKKFFKLFFVFSCISISVITAAPKMAIGGPQSDTEKWYMPKPYFGQHITKKEHATRLSIYEILPEYVYLEPYSAGFFDKIGGLDVSTGLAHGEFLQLYAGVSKTFDITRSEYIRWNATMQTPFPSLLPFPRNEALPEFGTLDVDWSMTHKWQLSPRFSFNQYIHLRYNSDTWERDKMSSTYTARVEYEKDLWNIGVDFSARQQIPEPNYEAQADYTANISFLWRFCGLFEKCRK
ncbi:MAG: hypothetical protein COW88_02280 [Candidatus Lloydbacteria bacterium CG22_combo_CG10-13_8_21_14_all_47_15]|uniref:Outer membrane protein beta-barrel domain-containing protein n=1 Tax=Candidatus Lloydbacteria bacterium CG22_combo_CG10-13_8_21_14_all_47_15 TaxID=1974635 RepID=A0A2H0CTW6_9BACT|nr:MAG: hypothetical protein COW88_02280 [Candidatus Lloydbacteria bacterium CG22_combo_CG10-13_8_21_14_all_47_15]